MLPVLTLTTYFAPAAIGVGVARLCCCQPAAVSLANVTLANSWPPAVQRFPTWVPLSFDAFQKRSALTNPGVSLEKTMPCSQLSAGPSLRFGSAGVWVVNTVSPPDPPAVKTTSRK